MPQQVLFICAHPDDEVIGAGGAILHHTTNGDNVNIIFLSDGESSRDFSNIANDIKDRRESSRKACSILGVNNPTFYDFSDNRMDDYSLLEIVKVIEKEVAHYKPSIIYTHHSGDLNIDGSKSPINQPFVISCSFTNFMIDYLLQIHVFFVMNKKYDS